MIFATSLSAHHAAFGIISDETWNMIDDNLTGVDSPHLSIDFDDVTDEILASPTEGSRIPSGITASGKSLSLSGTWSIWTMAMLRFCCNSQSAPSPLKPEHR